MEIIANTIKDAWPKVLTAILTKGIPVTIKVDGCQIVNTIECPELLNVMIKNPNVDMIPEGSKWSSETALEKYVLQVINNENTGHEYTYGKLIRAFPAMFNCEYYTFDQLNDTIFRLKHDLTSRQVVMSLWRIGQHNQSIHPPCIMVIQNVVRQGKCNINAYIRSNDMFGAVPENWYLLAKLNNIISCAINVTPGWIYTTSRCAHIYDTDVMEASRIVGLEEVGKRWLDEFGMINVNKRGAIP
jgi:thymidylate synthase (methanogen type)